MLDDAFRQKGPDQFPRGIDNQAVDANPSELSGSTSVQRPVWEKFVTNTVAQENNQAAVRAENDQIRSAMRMGETWKGADGKLLRKVGRQSEMLDAEAFTDHPVAGPEARKSLWDREVRTWRKDAQDAAFALRDPSFHSGAMTDKEREDALSEGTMLPETDPRHVELKTKLRADDDYRARKAELAQRSFDSEKRARELESTDPESWWSSRGAEAPSQQRAAVVADAKARAGEADIAADSATKELAGIDAKLAQGVRGSEVDALKARRAEIATGQAVFAQEKAKAAEQVRGVQEQAKAEVDKPFFGFSDAFSGIWDAVKGLGTTAPAAFYQLTQGLERPDKYSDSAKSAFAEADAYTKAMQAKNAQPGATDVGSAFREAGGSLGFSLGSMAAAIPASMAGAEAGAAIGASIGAGAGAPAGGVGAVPGAAAGGGIGGTIGGISAGMAASATAAYRMAGASFLNEAFQQLNAESQRKNGRPMNEEEMASAYQNLLPIAQNTALWEAGPEAVGNAVTLGAGKIVFGLGKPLLAKFGSSALGKAAVVAGDLATELGTETLTQVEQKADQLKAQALARGEDPDAIKADWSASGIAESFREVMPQTLALLGLMGGAGGVIKTGAMAVDRLRNDPTVAETSPEVVLEGVATELAAIDPEAAPPTAEEMARGSMIAPDAPAEGILIERELAEIEAEDEANNAAAAEAIQIDLDAAIQNGAKESTINRLRTNLEEVGSGGSRAPLVRAVLKIAGGMQADDLTDAERNAVGIAKSDTGEFSAMDDKELEDAGISTRMVDVGADGSLILTDGALKKVGEVSPRARGLVKMTEAQAIQKAKERAAQISTDTQNGTQGDPAAEVFPPSEDGGVVPSHETNAAVEFDVPMRDGTTLRVQAADGAAALEEAAAQAPISGQPATPVAATAPAKPGKAAPAKAKAEGAVNDSTHRDSLKMTPEERRADDKAIQRKLMEASLETDDKDEQFRRAGYQQVDGFWVHPHVDPAWIAGLKPETKARLKEGGIKFFDPEHESGGRMVSFNDGTRGMGVKTNADIGHSAYSKDITVLHELGHHVWQKDLTDQQREEFAKGGIRTEHGKEVASGKGRGETYNSSIAGGVNSVAEEDFAQHFAENGGDLPKTLSTPKSTSSAAPPAKYQPGKAALKRARAKFSKVKRRLKDRIIEGHERAATRPDGITINLKKIIDGAIARGMTDEQAADYFDRVLDEEVRHLAQYDAARALYRANGGTGDFLPWMESHYAAIWQSDFIATGKDTIIRDLYPNSQAEWDAMTDGAKALEAIRMMSQGDSVTEQGKLWANISDTLKQAITAALAALKQFRDIASPAIQSEITNLENALKQLNQSRPGDSKTDPKKPTPGKTGDGTGGKAQAKRDSGTPVDGGIEAERRDGAGSPLVVGAKVEFTKNGKTRTGKVEMIDKGSVLIRPDDNPGIAVGVDVGDVRVITTPSAATPEVESQALTDEVIPASFNEFGSPLNKPSGDTHWLWFPDVGSAEAYWVTQGMTADQAQDVLSENQRKANDGRREKAKFPSEQVVKSISDEYLNARGKKAYEGYKDPIDKAIYKLGGLYLGDLGVVQENGGWRDETWSEAFDRIAKDFDAPEVQPWIKWLKVRLQGKKAALPVVEKSPVADVLAAIDDELAKGMEGLFAAEFPEQNREYLAAVEAGDMEAAQRMVDEAAKAAGYDVGRKMFHGGSAINVISPRAFFTHDRPVAFLSSSKEHAKVFAGENGQVHAVYYQPGNQVETDEFNNDYEALNGTPYDSVISKGIRDAGFKIDEVVVTRPSQVKSADPVTRDAAGNVIPLSQRFNPASDSILYAANLPDAFTQPIPQDRQAILISTVGKYIAAGVNTPEGLAERLRGTLEGKLVPFSQSLWGLFKSSGVAGPWEPNWAGIYASTNQDAVIPAKPKSRKFDVNPVSDFMKEERDQATNETRRERWIGAQSDATSARDIASSDWEKLMIDVDRGRRGMTLAKATEMVESAVSTDIITREVGDRIIAKIQPEAKPVTNQSKQMGELVDQSRDMKFAAQDAAVERIAGLSESDLQAMDKFELADLLAAATRGIPTPWPNKETLISQILKVKGEVQPLVGPAPIKQTQLADFVGQYLESPQTTKNKVDMPQRIGKLAISQKDTKAVMDMVEARTPKGSTGIMISNTEEYKVWRELKLILEYNQRHNIDSGGEASTSIHGQAYIAADIAKRAAEPVVETVTAPAAETKAAKAVAKKPDTAPKKLKAQKEYLLAALDKAIEEAPESRAGTWDDPKAAGDAMLVQSSANEAAIRPVFEKYGFPTDEGFTKLEERTRLVEEIYNRHFTKPTSEKIIEIEVPGDGTFRIVNDKQTLKDFRKNANTRFPTTTGNISGPTSTTPRETAITKIGKPETNKDFVAIVGMFVSNDPQREVLHVVQSDGENVVATNGRQVLVLKRHVAGTEEKPAYFDAKTQKMVKLEGNYPGWKQVIPRDFTDEVLIDTAAVQKIAIQAKSVAGKDDGNQELYIWRDASGKMGYTLQSQDVTEPNGQSFLGGLYSGGEANPETAKHVTTLNVFYFLDGLKAMRLLGHEKVAMKVSDVSTMLEADGVQYVQSAMRLKEDPLHPLSEAGMEAQAKMESEAAAVAEKEKAESPVTDTLAPADTRSAIDVSREQYEGQIAGFRNGNTSNGLVIDAARRGKFLGFDPDQVYKDLIDNGVPVNGAAYAVETINTDWSRPAEKSENFASEFNVGDKVTFTPKAKSGTVVSGVLQDKIKNTSGGVGYQIFSPTETDRYRVVRVWADDGEISSQNDRPDLIPTTPSGHEVIEAVKGKEWHVTSTETGEVVKIFKSIRDGFMAQSEGTAASSPGISFQSAQGWADNYFEQAAKPDYRQSTATQEPAKAPSRIEDFGEKILGAKKDLWGRFKHAIEQDLPGDVADMAISKIFPEPDYESAIAQGIPADSLASYKAIRDAIPSKPRKGYKLERWVTVVRGIHPLMQKLATGENLSGTEIEAVSKLLRGGSLGDKINFYKDLGFPAFQKADDWRIIDGVSMFFENGVKLEKPIVKTVGSFKGRFTDIDSTKPERQGYIEVLDRVRDRIIKQMEQPSEKKDRATDFSIYSDRLTKDVFIGKKAVNGVIRLKTGFSNSKFAQQYLEDNREQLEEQWNGMKAKPDYRRQVNAPRQGPVRRDGDATPEQFQDAFGFRGVQFGNWVEGDRRQVDINEAFDAFMDLAEALGIPPRAVSLDGSLGLAFGARGHAGAAAHYEPGQVVINLTKMSGPGSLAHEWFHAFDNYFARLDATGETKAKSLDAFATTGKSAPKNMRPEVWQAFKNIRAVLAAGPFAERSKKLDDAKSKPYYQTTIEKAARAFERYTVDRLEGEEISNDYLVNIVKDFDPALPTEDEMNAGIREAFDKLFGIIDAVQTDDGVMLRSSDLPPTRKIIKINRELSENTRDLQRRFNKNIASGKLASFGNNRSRIEQDIVDAQYEHERARKTNEDAMMVGRKRLESSRADVEEKLLKAAYGEDVALDAADEMAFRYLINERSEQAGDDIEKHLENGKLRMALRLQRADLARRMQIGYDRLMTPAERAIEALSAAIYTPSGKVERYAEKLPASKRKDFMETAMRERLEKVEKELAKLGVTLGQVTGKNRDLQLANSKLMKDINKLRNVLEQGIIKMVQKGASMTDIKRRYGVIGFDQAQDVIQKAREELFAKINEMAKSGMSRDQIREAMKDGLKAAPLGSAASGMSADEIWKMIEEDFGLPKEIPATSLPTAKSKKPKAELTEAELEKAENEAMQRTAKKWFEKLAKSQSDTLSWGAKAQQNINEMEALIREHVKNGVTDFREKAEALGATSQQSFVIDKEAIEERRRVDAIKAGRVAERAAAEAARNTPEAIAKRWIDKFAKSQSDTQEWGQGGKPDQEISKLIKKHLKNPIPDFVDQVTALGATSDQARVLDSETARERAILAQIKEGRKLAASMANPLTSDWSRPEFTDGMNAYTFDTKDREGIMQRVEVIRGLAGALGKIDSLTGENRAKAEAQIKEIDQILSKYGTDAKGIFNAAQNIEDYGFDVTDVAQVAAVSRAISMIDADIVDKASEWLYFSMLSGLQTMMVNATAIVPAAWETTVGRGFESAINLFFKDPMSAQLGESKYILKAIRPALTRAWSNAQTAFAAQHPMFDRDVLAQEIDWERVMGGKGYRTGGSISGKWGDRIRIPMRILTATDDFNTTLMACVEVGTFAARIAKAKGMKPGSPEFNAFIEKEVNEAGSFSYVLATEKAKSAIFSNPLPGQHDPVTGKKVPVNDLGDAAGYLAGKITDTFSKEHDNLFVKTTFAAMRIAFFPFQRTPFNILRKGVRYTLNPFSLFDIGLGIAQNSRTADGKWEWNAKGRNPELIRRMAMQMQGAMLMLLVAGLAEGDDDDQDKPIVITGSAPFSPRGQAEREAGARSGLGPYRISFRRKDGSERFGFSYGRLEPLATTLAASVDIMKSIKRTLRGGGDASDAASAAMGGFVAQAQDKSFLRGVGDFTELVTNALAEPDLKDNRKMQQFLAGRVAMVMPNIIRQPIRESDENFRERSAGFMQELLYQTVPTGKKPAKVDPYGQPVTKPGTALGRTVDVTDAGTDTVHPMDRMLLKFRDKHPDKAWFPSVVNSAEFTNRKTGKSEKMNPEQLSEFKRMAGLRLDAALKTARLNLANPTERDIEAAKELVQKSRSDAKKLLSFKYSR